MKVITCVKCGATIESREYCRDFYDYEGIPNM